MNRFIKKHKVRFCINVIMAIITAALNLYTVILLKNIVDITETKDLVKFKHTIIFAIIFFIVAHGIGYLANVLLADFIKKVMMDVKNSMMHKLLKKNISDFTEDNSAKYISIFNNDLTLIENDYFRKIFSLISAGTLFLIAVVTVITLSMEITLSIVVVSIGLVLIPQLFNKILGKTKNEYMSKLEIFNVKIKDLFSGFEIIKSFNIENKVEDEFHNTTYQVEDKKYKFALINNFVTVISSALGVALFLTTIAVGTYLSIQGKITIGTVIAAIQLMNYLLNPINEITGGLNQIKSVKPIENKIIAILDGEETLSQGQDKNSFNESIEFKNINFAYEDKLVLKDISFNINKGEKIAIVGLSGSGKSTLLKLLLKYYDNYKGSILMDTKNIRDINDDSIHKLISITHQNVFMFEDTVKNNIELYSDYDKKVFNEVVKDSGLMEMIQGLPSKEESIIKESGGNVSGGEKQRISIARAFIKNTPILALDEFNSSLDNKTLYDIEDRILCRKDLTSICVTHKLYKSLLERYNKIIVLKDGEIIEMGTFNELINNKGYFFGLYSIQG